MKGSIIPLPRFLRLSELTHLTGLSTSTIYLQIKANKFPKPYKITDRSSGWLESEVRRWLMSRSTIKPEANLNQTRIMLEGRKKALEQGRISKAERNIK